tara:strand:- start:10827 stop:12098 length:1272 start_codon:yes stop_codon:yes gene_type:complete
MSELINIFFLIVIVILLLSTGLFSLNENNKGSVICLDIISKNLILFLNFIWVSSIFNFQKIDFSIFFIIVSFILFFIVLKKKKYNLHLDFFLLFTIILISVLAITLSNDLFIGHDSRLYWIEKAKIFYNDQFVNDDKTIKNEYPHYGTYLWAFIWKINYLEYEYIGRIFYLLVYVFSISYLVNSFNTKVVYKMIIVLIIILLTYENKHFDGRQDILLFCYNMFISRFLFEIFLKNKEIIKNLILIILTLNLMIWTKTEGILYLIIYGLILIVLLKKKLKLLIIISIFAIITIKISFYIYWNISLNPSAQMYNSTILQRFGEIDIIYRSYMIFYWYIINFIKNPLIITSIVFVVIIFLNNKSFLKKFNYIFIFYLLITLGIFASYLPTNYDFPFAMIGSFDRIIFQHSGIFLIPIIHFFNEKFK